jgi:hypothetical protein
VAREQHEVEPILDLVDAVLNGDSGHAAVLLRCALAHRPAVPADNGTRLLKVAVR